MKKKIKGILAFLISIIICFSFLPITAYADGVNYSSFQLIEKNKTIASSIYLNHSYEIQNSTTYHSISIFPSPVDSVKVDKNDVFIVSVSSDLYSKFPNSVIQLHFAWYDKAVKDILNNPDEDWKYLGDNVVQYDLTNNFNASYTFEHSGYVVSYLTIGFNNKNSAQGTYYKFTSLSAEIQTEQTGFFNSVKNFFQQLFEKLTSGFDNIGNWFSQLGDKIRSFFSDLTNSIKSFFSELGNNLKEWFSNIGDWFAELGNNIKQWFVDIGDRIGGFFTTLWNRIWWGNENGESEYEPPVIDNKLNDILDTLDDYQFQLKGTIDTIGSAADSVSSYISTGTELVNGIINVAGAGFTALIVFGIVFVLVRKVVGR
ncbi:MAG: hypothetical protein J1E36_03830 [Eubacterium sp.]|nr:hypothetical protein [Eubacterium sp.]